NGVGTAALVEHAAQRAATATESAGRSGILATWLESRDHAGVTAAVAAAASNNGAPALTGRASASPSGLPAATPAVEPAGTDLPVDEGTATAVAAIAPVKGQITAGPRQRASTKPHPARPTTLGFSTANIAGLKHPQTIA